MKFRVVAEIFNQIEKESSRIEITKLLADLFKKSTPDEAAIVAYISLGDLDPVYVGTQFHFADKSMLKVVAKLLELSVAQVTSDRRKLGDTGLIVEGADSDEWGVDAGLTIQQVSKFMHEFTKISGQGAQEAKDTFLHDILSKLDNLSAKYVIRVILGKLRLGFSDMTLLDAFSWMATGDKSLRKPLENAYNTSADIGLIVKTLKDEGIEAIEKMKVHPGVPIRPAAAERLSDAKAIVEKIGNCVAQPKLDGFRLQVHVFKEGGKQVVRFFSRNLQDMSQMFPELYDAACNLASKDFVAEGEAIAYDAETGIFLPFQETVKRRRKYDIEETAKDVPLKLFFFDLLYLDGKSLLNQTHEYRRKKMLSLFGRKKEGVIAPLEETEIKNAVELEKYFLDNISLGLEGLVVKRADSVYTPGKRNFNWIKLKRQETGELTDTIDCVIFGYYAGHGKRASFGIGALLVGVYNKKEDRFETIAKIGTGLTDVEWREQKKMCDKIAVKDKPKNVSCAKELFPDVWVSPEIVCLIRADEITLSPLHKAGETKTEPGFALRFPRLMGYRPDKSAKEATDVDEIQQLYKVQFGGKDGRSKKKKEKKVEGQKTLL